ncbi:MAG: M81 family metallopeptidase [Paracoccaceae bacterium]|nr:M81 family metallopeptidase [Paracoccaceae bacterium]
MTRVFIGGIATETNSFATIPTTMRDFDLLGVHRGTATAAAPAHFTAPLHRWRALAEAAGCEVVEGLMAAAQPGGTTLAPVWAALKAMLLEDIRAAGDVDMVLLNLHGAMIADAEDDCEGTLLREIRAILPDAVIGAELDLHCHLTDAMVEAATILMPYKEYPHTDIAARADDLWRLAYQTARGEITPVAGRAEARMVSVWRTTTPPMDGFVADMVAREGKDGVLMVSFCHGFALGDVPQQGSWVLVYTDGDPALAQSIAEEFRVKIWELRDQTRLKLLGADDTVQQALALRRNFVVIADTADNAGSGAGSDSTYLVTALQKAGVRGAVVGMIFDPGVVEICLGVGEGAAMRLRIGGKFSPQSGPPLDLDVRVLTVRENHSQTTVGGPRMSVGNAVVLETADGLLLVLNDQRTQVFHPDVFEGLGLDLTQAPIVVVKSVQHFHAGFAPVASAVLFARTESAIQFEGPMSPFKRRGANYWPLVDDPFAAE